MAGRDPDRNDDDVPAPVVPEDRLTDDWQRTDQRVEMLFEVRNANVRGHTLVYEDQPLRTAVRAATDGRLDQPFRFFFATRLTFRPSLPSGVGTKMVLPIVRREARAAFADDLRDRGFESVDQGRSERVRNEGGERIELEKVTATFTLPVIERELPIEGWVGAWDGDGLYVAGGAYPGTSLASIFESGGDLLARSPATYRDELIALVRAVGQ